jgi:hypothetical protein
LKNWKDKPDVPAPEKCSGRVVHGGDAVIPHPDGSFVRQVDPGYQVQQRTFSHPAFSHNHIESAGGEPGRCPAEYGPAGAAVIKGFICILHLNVHKTSHGKTGVGFIAQ